MKILEALKSLMGKMRGERTPEDDAKFSRLRFLRGLALNDKFALRQFDRFDVAASIIDQAKTDPLAAEAIHGHRASRVIRNRPRLKAMLEAT